MQEVSVDLFIFWVITLEERRLIGLFLFRFTVTLSVFSACIFLSAFIPIYQMKTKAIALVFKLHLKHTHTHTATLTRAHPHTLPVM